MPTRETSGVTVCYEGEPWRMAEALRGSMVAAKDKHAVLALVLLKHISDASEEQHQHHKLETERAQGADPEDLDEYRAHNILRVPHESCLARLNVQAGQPTIGRLPDDAVADMERDNPALIRELQQRLDRTREQSRQKVGVPYSTVNHWENGKRVPLPFLGKPLLEPRAEVVAQYAEKLPKQSRT